MTGVERLYVTLVLKCFDILRAVTKTDSDPLGQIDSASPAEANKAVRNERFERFNTLCYQLRGRVTCDPAVHKGPCSA